MKRFVLPAIAIILVVVLAVLVVKGVAFKPAKAGLKVESSPRSTVYLDGEEVGQTLFEDKQLSPGEKTLRLVPEDSGLFSWETRIKLTGGALSFVSRDFAETEALSSGKIITMEKLTDSKKIALTIISSPDSCSVKIDGEEKGHTPVSLEDLPEGDHQIVLSSPGFKDIQVSTQITPGFRFILNFKLAQKEEAEEKAEEEEKKEDEEPARPYVEIKDTPTGWLRVRMEPSISATEAAKVNPGEKYPLLDEDSGWYKIPYEKNKEGWISGQHAEKYE